jgi:hypothetical protein
MSKSYRGDEPLTSGKPRKQQLNSSATTATAFRRVRVLSIIFDSECVAATGGVAGHDLLGGKRKNDCIQLDSEAVLSA